MSSRTKSAARKSSPVGQDKTSKAAPLHEWSVVAYHQLNVGAKARHAQTRESYPNIKSYEEGVLWAKNFIRTHEMVSLVEVCHVEKDKTGKTEDVAIHRFFNSMGVWKQSIRKKPWFEGTHH